MSDDTEAESGAAAPGGDEGAQGVPVAGAEALKMRASGSGQQQPPEAEVPTLAPADEPGGPRSMPPLPAVPRWRLDLDGLEGWRKRNLVLWGIVLLCGFLLPLLGRPARRAARLEEGERLSKRGEGKVVHLNVSPPPSAEVGAAAVLFLVYPGVAGAAVIVLSLTVRRLPRALSLTVLGAVPVAVWVASGAVRADVARSFEECGCVLPQDSVLLVAGLIGLFVGIRSRQLCPGSRLAGIIGVIGGVFFLLWLVLPKPHEGFASTELMRSLDLLGRRRRVYLGLGAFASWACLAAASVLCFVNVVRGPRARGLARAGLVLFVLSFIFGGLGAFGHALGFVGVGGLGGRMVLFHAKWFCWRTALVLLIAFGLADVVAVLSRRASLAAPARHGPPPVVEAIRKRLVELRAMLDGGLIAAAEYDEKKAGILAEL